MSTQLASTIDLTSITVDLTVDRATQPDSNPDTQTRKTATMFQLLDHKTPDWFADARCADGAGTFAWLFFSEDLSEIARAKAICANCSVREACLDVAVERRESWGVWGGELLMNGKVLAAKRRRGRPPKVAPMEIVIDELGEVISA